jgi:hypothetical protein
MAGFCKKSTREQECFLLRCFYLALLAFGVEDDVGLVEDGFGDFAAGGKEEGVRLLLRRVVRRGRVCARR